MSNKFSNIKERILYILEFKGITKTKFFEEIGVTYGNFTGKAKETPLNSTTLSNIFSKYPDINLEWLLTGNGEMLKKDYFSDIKFYPHDNFEEEKTDKDYIIEIQKKYIKSLEDDINTLKEELKARAKT